MHPFNYYPQFAPQQNAFAPSQDYSTSLQQTGFPAMQNFNQFTPGAVPMDHGFHPQFQQEIPANQVEYQGFQEEQLSEIDRQPPQWQALERRVNQLERQNRQQEREITQLTRQVERMNRRLIRVNQRLRALENRFNIPFTPFDGEF